MGGHGGSSGYKKKSGASNFDKAVSEIADLKMKVQNGEDIPDGYSKAKKLVLSKYGIESGPDGAGAVIKAAEEVVAENKKKAAQAAVPEELKNLPGLGGNPWPPDADNKHLEYQGGGGLGIWNQFGGGVKNGGVSSQTAKDMYGAIDSFSGSGYTWIREAQAAGDTTSSYGKEAKLCEDFIAAGVKSGNGWTGGPTYRGIDGISNSAFNAYASLKPGDSVDPNFGGTASWSTHKNTSFNSFSGGPNSVVFIHMGNSQPKGVSIDKISSHQGENEVLVSKDSKYKVQHVATYQGQGWGGVGYSGTNYLLVYVEDA